MRVNITLEHKESGERLYLTSKNKRNTPLSEGRVCLCVLPLWGTGGG